MKTVLFICQANVGRSQMAEGFYNYLTNSKLAKSAGVEDFAEKYKYHPTAEIIESMAEKGIDISKQRIKVLTPGVCKTAKRIVVLCKKELCPHYLLSDPKTIFCEVNDPFEKEKGVVNKVRDEIETIVKGLL